MAYGRPVAAHAMTAEGMRRAVLAGVETVEHGDEGTRGGLPAHAAAQRRATARRSPRRRPTPLYFEGWVKGRDKPTPDLVAKRASFKAALEAGVTICFGGDVGVFPTARTCASSRPWSSTA